MTTEEELRAKQELKRRKQHEAWLRWYKSPKGQAYKAKRALKENQDEQTSQSPEQQ